MKVQERNIDIPILSAVFILVTFGLLMVYDSSVVQAFKDYGDKYIYIKQQLVWVALGIVALLFFSFFDYHNLRRLALPMFLFSILLLLAVFIPGFGIAAGGAHRWLNLGILSVQPAEVVKLTTVIFFASLFEKKARLLPFLTIVGFISFIIGFLQKDLGSTIVFFL